ncbi:hypothetical protein [Hydrogenophaga sp.]|uniref:hypothetical protein n=1 Tax=Hydrogenophaga sp. TaxID=1904254 RepID=UPI001ACC3B8B|nr:hypothetical protein [Hydrogenophaga sp.]MBN9373619.1 hypothetical protein [Hydrogenophaga sp.]
MFAFGSMFRFGFKPTAGDVPRVASEWNLSSEHSLLMHVRRGDTLRVDRGTVWIDADVPLELVELGQGDMHTVASDTVLRMTGIDGPRLNVSSRVPVKVSIRADYGGWRHQPPVKRARQARRRLLLA